MKIIEESLTKESRGKQAYDYCMEAEVFGKTIRVRMKVDSLEYQSYATMDYLTDGGWEELTSLHYQKMDSLNNDPLSSKMATVNDFRMDRDRLLSKGQRLLVGLIGRDGLKDELPSKAVDNIMECLVEAGVGVDDLDDVVHAIKSREATEINNKGMSHQVSCILQHCGASYLQEMIERQQDFDLTV